ncbi:MAG: hypothetical protein ACXVW7_11850 [Trebonia sp.]
MSDLAVAGTPVEWRGKLGTEIVPAAQPPDARRALQLGLAGVWLLDALLQYQPVMFTRAFGQMLAATAAGNPGVVARPITWDAALVEHHAVALNAVFATIQLLLGLGIALRPLTRFALAVSVAWSLAVWWFGEGLGGVLTGTANPVTGAPGAVILYALLAVLLWPADRAPQAGDTAAPFTAARAVGARAARWLWLVLWLSLAWFALQPANRAPRALHDLLAGQANGEPGWLAAIEKSAATTVGSHGLAVSMVLAAACVLVSAGVFLPRPAARATALLALVLAAVIWVAGQALGAILAGGATDPNSGLLLALIALAYWPARHWPARTAGAPS